MKKTRKSNISPLSSDPSLQEVRAACDALSVGAPGRSGRSQFREKMRGLWQDKRSFAMRAGLAALCAFAFAFTFIVFGPYELYIQSSQFLNFPFSAMVLPIAIAGLAVFAGLFLLLCILRGKLFNYAVSALFAVTIAGYLQRNFLNIDHGALDGHAIDWAAYSVPAVLNFLLWCGIAAAVFALMYFSRRFWTLFIRLVCIILIGAQTVALCSMLMRGVPEVQNDVIVSDADIFHVTDGNNVVFFLLDRLDNIYADDVIEANPQWQENLRGFTYYHNFTGSYTRTMPSICYLLTGVKNDYTLPVSEYFEKAWTTSTFIKDIHDAGYQVRLFPDEPYVVGDADNIYGLADNVIPANRSINYSLMYRYMLSLSAYVYAPEAFKSSFWMYTGDLAAISTVKGFDHDIYTVNDPVFWRKMREEGISVDQGEKGMFTFYHLSGAHEPFTMDENGEEVTPGEFKPAQYAQIAGNFNMIFRYIDDLKEKGLYDNTTIIVSADHARTGTLTALDGVRCPALLIKPANADTSAPMAISNKQVCHDNLRASIASYFGIDTEPYGRTIESIGEDEEMTRYFWMQACDPEQKHRDIETVTYRVKGDANQFENWTEISREPIQYPYYDAN